MCNLLLDISIAFLTDAQEDKRKLQELLDAAAPGSTIDINPNFDYLWKWQVKHVEKGMVFYDEGNSSLTLQFLLYCNGTAPHIVDYRNSSTTIDKTTDEQVVPARAEENTTSEGNISMRGNSVIDSLQLCENCK